MTLAIAVALLVVAGAVIALAARRRRPPQREAVMAEARRAPDMELAAPAPAPLPPQPEANPAPAITWTATLTEAALDEPARLRLIDDLALLDAPWAIALLRRAYQEESSPALRDRIDGALTSSGESVRTTR
jgi:hypothetical protein